MTLIAAIEGGGTKFNCAIVDESNTVLAETRVPTTTPDETLTHVATFFEYQKNQGHKFDHLGLACFGPLDLQRNSPHFGSITKTPKRYWSDTPILQILENKLSCKVAIDTDVNAAALAENMWGNGQNADVCVYVTVGTGVGGGIVIHGKPVHGLIHPELGHMKINNSHNVKGVCPFHGDCVEGLASGTAMKKIWCSPAEQLSKDHHAWHVESDVLAQMCHNLLVTISPQKLILGGGVMNPDLMSNIIKKTTESLQGYLTLKTDLSEIITEPGLGTRSGMFGAVALVKQEFGGG